MSASAMRRALAALMVAGSVAACGGSSTGASTPTAAVRTWLTAVAQGDGNKACSVIATSTRARALGEAKAAGVKVSSCSQLFSLLKARLSPTVRQDYLHAKFGPVTRSGSSAKVPIVGAGSTATVAKSGGGWQITGGLGF